VLDADNDVVPPPRVIGLRTRLALAGFDLGRPGVRAIAVLAGVVALAAAVLAWRAQPRAQPVAAAPVPVAAAASSPSPAATIVVAVSGLVRRPGLVRLPAGARVADAIAAAGGALPGTDLSLVNLARRLTDGELVVIGIPGVPDGGAPPGPGGAGGTASGPVNLNTATAEQLQALPGVGPVLAQRIIEFRTQHGGFRSVSELRQVSGLGDAKFAELKDLVTV
jgi:competence protein ComEA